MLRIGRLSKVEKSIVDWLTVSPAFISQRPEQVALYDQSGTRSTVKPGNEYDYFAAENGIGMMPSVRASARSIHW